MEKLAVVAVLLLCTTMVVAQSSYMNITDSDCDWDHEYNRVQFIKASRCRDPRLVLIDVPTPSLDIMASPQAVFVQRCVGVCTSTRHRCLPAEVQQLDIHVRYTNVNSYRHWCSVVSTFTHKSCMCKLN